MKKVMENWKKVFAIIWTGQFLSLLSSSIVNFAIILWISMETGSAEMLAYAAIAALLPQTLIGPVSGVYVDRWNRKLVMIASDSFIAVCTLVLAVLFWLGKADMVTIFVLLGLRSFGSAFHGPAMQASVPMLAPESQLVRIAGIDQMIFSVSNIAGPALGALLLALWKMEYVLLLDVAGAVIACTSLLFVHIPNPEKKMEQVKNVLHEMKEGVWEVLKNRGLSIVFLGSIGVMFFIMPVSVLFPLMTLDHFHGNAYQVSVIEVLWGAGALAGGAIMGFKVYKINKVVLVNCMYLLIGATFLLSGVLSESGFVWFAVLTAIGGVSGSVYHSSFTAIVQVNIDPAALGRVFSFFYTISFIPSLIGLVGIGFFAEYLGLTTSFVACGACIIVIGVAMFFSRSAMRLDRVFTNFALPEIKNELK